MRGHFGLENEPHIIERRLSRTLATATLVFGKDDY
jgi:hypothetical protein